jgi:DNA invertase Pin-like site-specific DNA recombinase
VGIEVDSRVRARAPPCRLSVPGMTSDQFAGSVFSRVVVRVEVVGFRSLTEALDTTTAQGQLVFHMFGALAEFEFGALAEFERSLIRERTQAGLAAARRAGRTGGRPPKLTDDDIEAAKAMLANPDIGVTQIAHRLGVSPATLYRYIPAARTANTPGV